MMPITDPSAGLLGPWSSQLTPGSVFLRLILALLLSAIIGWERSNKRHSAGLGAMAAILDCYIHLLTGRSYFLLSAASVIGAATICIHSVTYSSRNQIKGLTTAVGLWVSIVIGLAMGLGVYTVGLFSFAALMCTLFWFPPLEVHFKNRSNHFEIHLELTNSRALQDFVTVIRQLGMTIDEIELNPAYVGSGLSVYSIAISVSSEMLKKYKTHSEIIEALKTLDYIRHIEEMRG